MNLLVATLPAIIPWFVFYLIRSADHKISISSDSWELVYDYIIVGAGSAGCVLANRLTENSETRVLLLEAGGSENTFSEFPQSSFALQRTVLDWQYRTVPQPKSSLGFKDQTVLWPRGKVLGGTSAINLMFYIRGNRHDYDNWAKSGARGWSYEEVLPYFFKAEDNRDLDIAFNGYHGHGGPLTVQRSTWISPLAYAFLDAVQLFGYSVIDTNGPSQIGFQILQSTIRRGGRCSAAKAYLYNIRDRTNLRVVTFAFVTKILFNHEREAIGVQFDRFSKRDNRVFARKEVIISGGTINSPQLLMISGIGPRLVLEQHKIPVISDLPVGQNLQDHIHVHGLNFVPRAPKPADEFWTHMQSRVQTFPNFLTNLAIGRGPISSNSAIDATGFIRTKFANRSIPDLPDYQIDFFSACVSADNGRYMRGAIGLSDQVWDQAYKPLIGRECFQLLPVLLKPKSVGYLQIRSPDPYEHPLIQPNYYSHPDDLESMVDAMMMSYKFATSEPFRRKFDTLPSEHAVPGCERHRIYSRAYMKCVAQILSTSSYHPVGTCKMGSVRDPTTVVDHELRVKDFAKIIHYCTNEELQVFIDKKYIPIDLNGDREQRFYPVNTLPLSELYHKLGLDQKFVDKFYKEFCNVIQ